ncbi:hypothetical protein CSUI_009083 [Cystoisospora suis]|uniref:Uncharacterized protein n=1 Tax=Cystoisospora suis TaxID=483139 RepID=A0A2C6KHS7_9APIC|nr:hypothetical protein CSUI_009083 [Cystoisospora suis]
MSATKKSRGERLLVSFSFSRYTGERIGKKTQNKRLCLDGETIVFSFQRNIPYKVNHPFVLGVALSASLSEEEETRRNAVGRMNGS